MTTPNTTPLPTAETLAATFLRLLRAEVGDTDYTEACRLNAAEPKRGVCHSHDHCDANEVMVDAFAELGVEVDTTDDTQIALWNAAWEVAFAAMAREGARQTAAAPPTPSDVAEPDLNAIAAHLETLLTDDAEVTVEFPGCVCVWAGDLGRPTAAWWFGTANDTWQGDLQTAEGEHLGHLETAVPVTETNVRRIAAAIAEALSGPLDSPDSIDHAEIADMLVRAVSVFEETATDNPGETVAEAHAELYRELKRAARLLGGAR